MSELRRWTEEGATAEERALLRASTEEAVPQAVYARTLQALGLEPGGPPADPGGARGARTTARLSGLQKLSALVVAGAAISGAAWYASRRPRREPAPPVAVSAAATGPRSAIIIEPLPPAPSLPPAPAPTEAPAPADTSALSSDPGFARRRQRRLRRAGEPPLQSADVQPATAPAGTPESATPAARLAAPPSADRASPAPALGFGLQEEIAALERADRALARRDPLGALRLLDRYRALFAGGKLASEEVVLRARALLDGGEQTAAAALASDYIAAHPDSPFNARLRALVFSPAAKKE